MTPGEVSQALAVLAAELAKWRESPAWLAYQDPVAYLAVTRATRHGRKLARVV